MMGAAQPFDQVKSAIRNVLVRNKVQSMLQALQGTAKVEILDPELKKAQEDAQAQLKANGGQVTPAIAADPAAQGGGGAPAEPDTSGKGDLALPVAP